MREHVRTAAPIVFVTQSHSVGEQQVVSRGVRVRLRDANVDEQPCACRLGKVQMRDPDGRPAHRDANFLAETRTVPRELADRRVAARGSLAPQQRTAAPQGGEAVTIYSEAAAKGTYAGGFYGTKQHGATTFGKYANFSKVIGDCTKDPLATCE